MIQNVSSTREVLPPAGSITVTVTKKRQALPPLVITFSGQIVTVRDEVSDWLRMEMLASMVGGAQAGGMSKTIWKFPLPLVDERVLTMPKGAMPLAVQAQYNEIQLWALVSNEPDAEMAGYHVHIVGTGHIVPPSVGAYIGTVQVEFASVWHVFVAELA